MVQSIQKCASKQVSEEISVFTFGEVAYLPVIKIMCIRYHIQFTQKLEEYTIASNCISTVTIVQSLLGQISNQDIIVEIVCIM